MNKYIHFEDCTIVREKTVIQVYDSDGDVVLELPNMRIFTDSHMRQIIEIANKAFDVGVVCGKSRAQQEMRKALGIS